MDTMNKKSPDWRVGAAAGKAENKLHAHYTRVYSLLQYLNQNSIIVYRAAAGWLQLKKGGCENE